MAVRSLKICEYNVENLFLSLTYYDGQDIEALSEDEWKNLALAQFQRRQKPLAKLRGVAQAILDIDADLYLLVEVGGEESLENFNRHFLGDRYRTIFVKGNSDRHIDLAFLVRRDLAYEVEPRSNRDLTVTVDAYSGSYEARFARDIAELRLSEGQDLRLIVLLVHLKSKISSDQDHQGTYLRTAEANALAQHYDRLRAEHPAVPIVIGGDFNADLASKEFDRLAETDVLDVQSLLGRPPEERFTLVFFDYQGKAHHETLDYLLVSPHLRDRIDRDGSGPYRYKGFYEIPNEPPQTRAERYKMPSDHFPVTLTIRLEGEPPTESATPPDPGPA